MPRYVTRKDSFSAKNKKYMAIERKIPKRISGPRKDAVKNGGKDIIKCSRIF